MREGLDRRMPRALQDMSVQQTESVRRKSIAKPYDVSQERYKHVKIIGRCHPDSKVEYASWVLRSDVPTRRSTADVDVALAIHLRSIEADQDASLAERLLLLFRQP